MTQRSTDCPLVTFALLAYNQEKYIREAVEGAFAQTYKPLDIILSDDCSSDSTFEIIAALVEQYKGAHQIRMRRNHENLGLLNHVCSIAEIAIGELTIFAAGDDISEPHRAETIVQHWSDKYSAIYSKCDLIDCNSKLLTNDWKPESKLSSRLPWIHRYSTKHFVYGASSCYATELIARLPKAGRKVFSEDTPLNLMINLLGRRVKFCDHSLVRYRVHASSLSSSSVVDPSYHAVIEKEKLRSQQIQRQVDIEKYLRFQLVPSLNIESAGISQMIDESIEFHERQLEWYRAPSLKRLYFLIQGPLKHRRWFIVRVFGLKLYAYLRAFSLKLGIYFGQLQDKGIK